MAKSFNRFVPQILPTFAAIAISATILGAFTAPAFANRGAPEYRLTAEQSVTGTKVARDTLWKCSDAGCSAASATSRPEIVCATAVREIGKVSSFSVRGEAFNAAALAKCNAKAR